MDYTFRQNKIKKENVNYGYKKHNNETEFCVQCGTETQYKKRDSVDYRIGYIDGAGQLCNKCQKIYNNQRFVR